MSPRVHHAVFSVAGWLAGTAGFVAFCIAFASKDTATMSALFLLAVRAAIAGAFAALLVRAVGVVVPARCEDCGRWAARRISTRPATFYRCGRCGESTGVALEDGGPAQDALDDVSRARVDEALHESSPAAGQLSTPSAEDGALSPPVAGKLTLK